MAHEPPESRAAIFLRFLKFGALAWGGPAAQIAMIKRECVDEEHWTSEESFKKLLAVYQILPGPEAHELCVYFGRIRGGRLGGFLAGLGFARGPRRISPAPPHRSDPATDVEFRVPACRTSQKASSVEETRNSASSSRMQKARQVK